MPAVNMEKFYLQWRKNLLFLVVDGAVVLNYLYWIDLNSMLDQTAIGQMLDLLRSYSPNDYQRVSSLSSNQKQRLEQHKKQVIQKINEFGKYDDLDISDEKKADIQEHILKKYLWVLSFHNYVCIAYNIPDCMIKSGSTCDIRFMKMTVEIFEDHPSMEKQQEKNKNE